MGDGLKFNIDFGGVDINTVKEAWAKDEAKVQAELQRISKLKIPIDATEVIKLNETLSRTEKMLSRINAMQQKSTSTKPLTSLQAGKLDIQQANAEILTEQKRQTEANRTALAKLRLQTATDKLTNSTRVSNGVVSQSTAGWKAQGFALNGVKQTLGAYASVLGGIRLISQIREVTAEFELQRVALGAIIQDKAKADQLFAQVTQLAVQSPFQVKELITYTKELSAYRIETENLFDTTKRLADISAGLGVDMSRLVLAYGQVKAASVLRGQELRQFTEAGIPLVSLLADKFSLLRGEMVSTGEVFELISDRAVSFGMVKEIFEDMTNAGGTFYNMQKIQAETLYGSWSNLKDEIALAYNAMGQANYGTLKGFIDLSKELVRNWENIVDVLSIAAVGFGVYRVALLNTATAAKALTLVEAQRLATENASIVAAPKWIRVLIGKNAAMNVSIALDNAKVFSQAKLSSSTNILTKAFWKLSASILANPYVLAAAAIAGLVYWMVFAKSEATKMSEAIDEAHASVRQNTKELSDSMKEYSNRLSKAVKGSDEYRNVISELTNEYGKYIPKQLLDAENLTLLADKTDILTQSILRKKKAEAIEAGVTAAEQQYGSKMGTALSDITKELELSMDPSVASRVASEYMDAIKGQLERGENVDIKKTLAGVVAKEFNISIDEAKAKVQSLVYDSFAASDSFSKIGRVFGSAFSLGYQSISRLTENLEDALDVSTDFTSMLSLNQKKAESVFSTLNQEQRENLDARKKQLTDLAAEESKALEANKNIAYKSKVEEEESKLAIQQEYAKKRFDAASQEIVDTQAKIEAELAKPQDKNTAKNITILKSELLKVQTIYGLMAEEARVAYEAIQPTELNKGISDLIKNFAKAKGVSADVFSQMFKGTGEEIKAYGDRVKGLYDEMATKIAQLSRAQLQLWTMPNQAKLDESKLNLEALALIISKIGLETKSQSKSAQDLAKERADQLKTEIGIIKEAYSAYRKLETQLGADKAKVKISELYKDVFSEFKQLKGISPVFSDADFKKSMETALDTGAKILSTSDKLKLKVDISDEELKTLSDNLKAKLSQLQSEIDQQQKANKFFESMLGITGDQKLAADITVGIYGAGFEDTAGAIKEQLTEAFKGIDISLELSGDVIDYAGLLAKVKDIEAKMGKERADVAMKFAQEGADAQAKQVEDLLSSLSAYDTFEKKRTDIYKKGIEERNQIDKIRNITPEQKEEKKKASVAKEEKEIASLRFKEFKESDEWIMAFEDMDRLSTQAIDSIMAKMVEFRDSAAKNLSPTEVRELTNAIKKMRDEQEKSNPFKTFVDSMRDYSKASADVVTANQDIVTAEKALADAKTITQKTAMLDESGKVSPEYKQAMDKQIQAEKTLTDAKDKSRDASNKQKESYTKMIGALDATAAAASGLQSIISQVTELFGIAEDSEFGAYLGEVGKALGMVAAVLGIVAAAMIAATAAGLALQTVLWPLLAITAVVGLFTWALGAKKRAADKEIKKQEALLKSLRNAYDDLSRSIDKALGDEKYLRSGELINNLYKQQIALIRQADAEASKGKKTDQSKVDDLRREADLINQQIEDILEKLKTDILGGTAKDFAQQLGSAMFDALADGKSAAISAWDEAADQIVTNMVRKLLISKLLEKPLQELVDKFAASAVPDTTELEKAKAKLETPIEKSVFTISIYDELEKKRKEALAKINQQIEDAKTKGLNITGENVGELDEGIKNLGEDFYGWLQQFPDLAKYITGATEGLTGIKKNVAQASEDQITGLAAGINTQNGYFAQTVSLTTNIYEMMVKWDAEKGNGSIGTQQLIGIQNSALLELQAINSNTMNTVAELVKVNEKLDSVIGASGVAKTKSVTVTLK